jgi:DNA primase
MPESLEQATAFHHGLPDRIRHYLIEERSLTDEVIDAYLLGWNGSRITIPIFDRDNNLAFFKLAKDPEDRNGSPKMLAPSGSRAELYGWERVLARPDTIVICEGEFDRLVLESRHIAAVTSTAGAATFLAAWAIEFSGIRDVSIVFDNDAAGQTGARRVASLVPQARIAHLPQEVGQGGDVTDYFVRLKKSPEDFLALLAEAKPFVPPPEKPPVIIWRRGREEVDALKAKIPLTEVASRYLELRASGRNWVARCPFHDDQNPSFVLYRQTQTFFCFGCRANGDVFTFLMRTHGLSFREAVDVLRNLSNPHGETD